MNPSRSTGQHPPRLGTRAKVHHRSLQSDRRVRPSTFAEVWPIERSRPARVRRGLSNGCAPLMGSRASPRLQEVWAFTLALYRSESSCPPDSAPTAPLIVLRAKVHHCSLQSDRRVPFEEVCPIAH